MTFTFEWLNVLKPLCCSHITVIAPDLDKINLIKELLSVKFHKGQISLICESEVDFMIWFLCTS